MPVVKQIFAQIYLAGPEYRASGIVLGDLITDDRVQLGLFDDQLRIEKMEQASHLIDQVNHRFGKHKLHLAASLPANSQHHGYRERRPVRKDDLLKGETSRQRLGLPMTYMQI